jgi:hypothetical protein
MIRTILISTLLILTTALSAQKNNPPLGQWTPEHLEDYKPKGKINGASAKEMKKHGVFISDYKLNQFVQQKGSNNQGSSPTVFGEATLAGVEEAAYQRMVNELHAHLATELEAAGVTVVSGEAVIQSETAQKQQNGKGKIAAVHNGDMEMTKVMGAGQVATFRPEGPAYFSSNDVTSGLYQQKLARKEEVVVALVKYDIMFAGFGKTFGYKSKGLEVGPFLQINLSLTLITPKGQMPTYFVKKTILGNNDWCTNVTQESVQRGSQWGLSSSASWNLVAEQELFLKEISSIIKAVQTDAVNAWKEKL